MNQDNKHIDLNSENTVLQSKIKIEFDQSKEDLWQSMEGRISESKTIKLHPSFLKYSVAAVLIVLLAAFTVVRFYSTTIQSNNSNLSYILPDQSKVILYAHSEIEYQPYWWFVNRKLSFKGDAYFEVEKGQKFEVESSEGTTEVLGTKFKIFARDKAYNVYCKSGRVKVSSPVTNLHVFLKANEFVAIDNLNKKAQKEIFNLEEGFLLESAEFKFESMPLNQVLKILEHQYQVKINIDTKQAENIIYTGYFTKPKKFKDALDLICQTLNIKFVKQNPSTYKVSFD